MCGLLLSFQFCVSLAIAQFVWVPPYYINVFVRSVNAMQTNTIRNGNEIRIEAFSILEANGRIQGDIRWSIGCSMLETTHMFQNFKFYSIYWSWAGKKNCNYFNRFVCGELRNTTMATAMACIFQLTSRVRFMPNQNCIFSLFLCVCPYGFKCECICLTGNIPLPSTYIWLHSLFYRSLVCALYPPLSRAHFFE